MEAPRQVPSSVTSDLQRLRALAPQWLEVDAQDGKIRIRSRSRVKMDAGLGSAASFSAAWAKARESFDAPGSPPPDAGEIDARAFPALEALKKATGHGFVRLIPDYYDDGKLVLTFPTTARDGGFTVYRSVSAETLSGAWDALEKELARA